MKKFLALSISMIMLFTVASCGEKETKKVANEPQENSSETVKEPDITTSEQPDADAVDKPQDNSSEEVKEPETTASEQPNADISSAIDASTTTDTAPIPFGQWAKTARYATEDKTYHTVYVRVTKVTTSSDDAEYVQSAIDLHNTNSYDFSQIDVNTLQLPSDVELCVLDYEVFVPEEFPGPDYGIVEPNMSFSQENIGGGGIPSADGTSTYIGMGSNSEDLATEKEPTYQPGNTYAFRSLFTMVKGYTDYVFEFTSYPDGTGENPETGAMYHAYFANK